MYSAPVITAQLPSNLHTRIKYDIQSFAVQNSGQSKNVEGNYKTGFAIILFNHRKHPESIGRRMQ